LLAAASTTLPVIGQSAMGPMPSNYDGLSRVSVRPLTATTYSLMIARPGSYATSYWPRMPSVNSVWGGDPFYVIYPPSHMSTWPMVPAVYQAPIASVAQSVPAPQVVDLGHSTVTQITTTTTSFVSVIDASRPQNQTNVTATIWVVRAMSGPAGTKLGPGSQLTAAAVPGAGRSTTVAVDPTTTTTTTTDLLLSTRPSTASTSAPPI